MYLPEEKRDEIRNCIKNRQSGSGVVFGQDKKSAVLGLHATEDSRKISQILFDARDGKELFTPFR
ncbi:MAG: hypothetical protein KKE44_13080 [Proteobacteria bacterium]|nr:hypothetical protein [Pseudomonadota bacterium]MBU1583659.1 hypothetical protein [Pseudomonadota bacterium]MBU2453380.1 hypothetical protein [Pseudomonadota bacterium]MBU2629719.1 hypothetical protein [Pseudomonadota bacterium]